jgi:HK97 family phage major capsid protein
MELTDVKQAVDAIGTAFEEFKKVNDQRISDLEKKGASDPLLDEQLTRINDFIDKQEDMKAGLDKARTELLGKQEDLRKEYGERFDKLETVLKRSPRGPTDEKTQGQIEAKQVFEAWARKGTEMDRDLFKLGMERKLLSVGNDQQAGYLAPSEYVMELIKGIIEFSPIRTIARVRTTSRTSIQVPRRTGTFAAAWTAEQGTRAETTGLQYGLEDIPTHEMYALVDITEQMLEDSVFDLESELNMEFTEQFGVLEGTGFVTGNAAGQPEGFMTNGDVSETNSGSAATIADTNGQADGLIDLQHGIPTAYGRNATWTMNRTTLGSVRKLKDGNNQYIWAAGIAVGDPNTVLGDPVVEATDMASEAANAFPIAYGDFRRAYSIVDRVSMSVLRDPFTQATSGAIRFIARRRVGGQVVLAEAIRKLKCST